MKKLPLYGLAAEFAQPSQLVEAARLLRSKGFRKMEAFTPYPIEELDEILYKFNPLPAMVFTGGALGAATAWIMQYYIAAIDYPINVGGRPLYSWPSFIVITFELTILFAACTAFFGTLALCGFPRPNFPMFNLERFRNASRDRFFLCLEARDPIFDSQRASELFSRCEPVGIYEIENS
jgi:hypothetical protein